VSSRELVHQGGIGGEVTVEVVETGSNIELLQVLKVWLQGRKNDV
jgi:hypothetical protein